MGTDAGTKTRPFSQKRAGESAETLWARHHAEWRDTAQVASQWREAADLDPHLLRAEARGRWWDALAATGATLLITREYEHLLMAVTVTERGPQVSYLPMPHPSGLVADRERGRVYVASTRNPNQVFELAPVVGALPRLDVPGEAGQGHPLVPAATRYYPGCLYMHDLALVGGALYANAVGENAVVRLCESGGYERVWWPRCAETADGPLFARNHLQLNSIAAGPDLAGSYFSASADRITRLRPGHRNFPVDRRGVIFSGATREPVVRGLTRPHSARLDGDGRLWVDNSGYGEVGVAADGLFQPVTRLPGWTRGLCFHGRIAFVGTSRVIPRFSRYAPGLDVADSTCAVHAVDTVSGDLLGSLAWPAGNQIFAVDWLPARVTEGFPFATGRRVAARERRLFYAYTTETKEDKCRTTSGS